MMGIPSTLHEFYTMFPHEEACWKRLKQMRWPRGFVCPRCDHRGGVWIQTRKLYQCRSCRYQSSVTAGTVMHRTRIPLRTWFLAIFLLGRNKQGVSAATFQKLAGLGSYQTAWHLLHRIRSTLCHRSEFRLTGLVEADETYVGARHVTGAIDLEKAEVLTDGWGGYVGLGKAHVKHRPTVQGSGKNAHGYLPIHTVFSNLKSWLRGTFHGVNKRHLGSYLQEFVYLSFRRSRTSFSCNFVKACCTQRHRTQLLDDLLQFSVVLHPLAA